MDKIKPQAELLWCRGPLLPPGNLAPSLLPAGRDPWLHQAPPPHATGYQQEGREESAAKETVAERGTNREFEMLKRWGGIFRLPFPSRAFLYCPAPAATAPLVSPLLPWAHPPCSLDTFSSSMATCSQALHDPLLPHFLLKTTDRGIT